MWAQHTSGGLNSAEEQGRITSFSLRATVLLPKAAHHAGGHHCQKGPVLSHVQPAVHLCPRILFCCRAEMGHLQECRLGPGRLKGVTAP